MVAGNMEKVAGTVAATEASARNTSVWAARLRRETEALSAEISRFRI